MSKQRIGLVVLTLVMVLALGAFVFAAGGGTAAAEEEMGQKQVAGKVLPSQSQALRHAKGSLSEAVTSEGAKFIRLHFVDFDLAEGAVLTVSSPDGAQKFSYTGRGVNGNGDFWSFAIDGDAVNVDVQGQGSYRILDMGHGTIDLQSIPTPEIVVGTDGREDIACHTGEAVVNAAQKPVARLLFTVKRSQYLCTGELVRGSNANTLITNNHCFADQTATSTLEARFNYQYTTCGGATLEATTSYAGGTFLKTNAVKYSSRKPTTTGLDYTIVTLQGTPETTFGELIPTSATYAVGTQMNFIQHPAGLPKKIGYWEDAEHTIRCKIDTINMTYGSSAPNSQAGYGCDSEGGSSGSAITRASDGKMIALHHYGGVTTVLNSGTMMALICTNAVGMGIDILSTNTFAISHVKEMARKISIDTCKGIVSHIFEMKTASAIYEFMSKEIMENAHDIFELS